MVKEIRGELETPTAVQAAGTEMSGVSKCIVCVDGEAEGRECPPVRRARSTSTRRNRLTRRFGERHACTV